MSAGEICIFLGQAAQAPGWSLAHVHSLTANAQLVYRLGVHLLDQIVKVFEHLVERAACVADGLRYASGRKGSQTAFADDLAGCIQC